jgi:integrase
MIAKGNRLAIAVAGAKCVDAAGRARGQPRRLYEFDVDEDANPALRFLYALAARDTSNPTGITHDSDYLYNSIVKLGKEAFPKLRTRISPYCFRHQAASDLKADPSVSLEDAAKYMGHLSDYSVGRYGHAVHGRRAREGQCRPIVLKTDRAIKHSPKVDRLARFKTASAAKRDKPKV